MGTQLNVRLTEGELELWRQAAAASDMTLSGWVRSACALAIGDRVSRPSEGTRFAPSKDELIAANRSRPKIIDPPPKIDTEEGTADTKADPPPCRHPKTCRKVMGYGTFCDRKLGGCGARL